MVKHRACLPVGRLIVGVQARSFGRGSQVYRRDSCQIQVAVRCERRVVIVVERRARLSVGRWIAGVSARLFGW